MPPGKRTVKTRSGSPTAGEPEYLQVGVVRRPHGLGGELLLEIITDFPERLTSGKKVFVGAERQPCIIQSVRQHNAGLLIKLKGVDTPESARTLRNKDVYVSAANLPSLPRGTYYHHQLLGSEVVAEGGAVLGRLTEILQTGANDVYVVALEAGKELLLPALQGVILQIDLDRHTILVRVPEGLREGRDS